MDGAGRERGRGRESEDEEEGRMLGGRRARRREVSLTLESILHSRRGRGGLRFEESRSLRVERTRLDEIASWASFGRR